MGAESIKELLQAIDPGKEAVELKTGRTLIHPVRSVPESSRDWKL